ncbi:MAG: hypothetical protein IIZ66_04085 [Clostridia bacterium]|nr:hypothetical protein [Clostridia bacterium]
MADWIWLPQARFPEYQTASVRDGADGKLNRYAVVRFTRNYAFDKEIKDISLTVSGDTYFELYRDKTLIFRGPPMPGGDFLNDDPAPNHYATAIDDLGPSEDSPRAVEFTALVRLSRLACCEYSRGHGGFYLSGRIGLEDGSSAQIGTDGTWTCAIDRRYAGPRYFDGSLPDGTADAVNAEVTPDIWNAVLSDQLRLCYENTELISVTVEPRSTRVINADIPSIKCAYVEFTSDAPVDIKCRIAEAFGEHHSEINAKNVTFYRSDEMFSFGEAEYTVTNAGDRPAVFTASVEASHYPAFYRGSFECDDDAMNEVFDVCRETLDICRQSIHLDSPKHQELLACTGDYYIEMLMEAAAFGDLSLSRADIKRTADQLCQHDGRLFHTTYSLIFVSMFLDYYMYTADTDTLKYCEKALGLLFRRFAGYIGENGILDDPPDYMFVDWIVVDGYSMHHPPKILGQTALNAFYAGALLAAEKIYAYLGRDDISAQMRSKYDSLKSAMNAVLFDEDRMLYVSGLPGKTKTATYLPQNPDRQFFLRHAQTLCVLYGIAEGGLAAELMRRVMDADEDMPDYQPYFAHFVFDALYKTGLYGEYAPALLARWKPMVAQCPKGLAEGWIRPEEGYRFDHSHAWGGTALYQLMFRGCGIEIVEPGFKKILLHPQLFDFEYMNVTYPTPFGDIRVQQRKGEEPHIAATDGMIADPAGRPLHNTASAVK